MALMGFSPLSVDGGNDQEWIIMDFGFVMVHLMLPEARDRYHLEELWQRGRVVTLPIRLQGDEQK